MFKILNQDVERIENFEKPSSQIFYVISISSWINYLFNSAEV